MAQWIERPPEFGRSWVQFLLGTQNFSSHTHDMLNISSLTFHVPSLKFTIFFYLSISFVWLGIYANNNHYYYS